MDTKRHHDPRYLSNILENVLEHKFGNLSFDQVLVADDYPIMIKINSEDFVEGGATIEDSLALSRMLKERGIDAIEVSGGTGGSGEKIPARVRINTPEKEAYHAEYARRIAVSVKVPVILVGGLRSPEVIEGLLQGTPIEFFSLARPCWPSRTCPVAGRAATAPAPAASPATVACSTARAATSASCQGKDMPACPS